MDHQQTQHIITHQILLDAAGAVYFQRGEDYFESGLVSSTRERDGIIRATVAGTTPYKTTLYVKNGKVDGTCSCPLGRNAEFCKHLVATGLAYIEKQEKRTRGKASKPATPEVVEDYLLQQDTTVLVRLIMEQADIDDDFYSKLKLLVASKQAGMDTQAMRRLVYQAMTIRDFVSWRDTGAYIRGIDLVLNQLQAMLTSGHALQVIGLIEYAMDLWEKNIHQIDDSDGSMGMLRDDLHHLHLEACMLARPDPVKLAERLARRSITSEWEMFYGSYANYQDVFGKDGCLRYREIAEKEWNTLPRIGPGEDDSSAHGKGFTLDQMMLAIAREEGDLNLEIQVLSRNLSHGYSYLRIAERLRELHKYQQALEWAERGTAAFPHKVDSRLRTFLSDIYIREQRFDDAMAMIWANFKEGTTLDTYQNLAKLALKLEVWDTWREKAFTHIREDLEKQKDVFELEYGTPSTRKRSSMFRWMQPPDASLAVAILLWEKKDDEAWIEAQKGGCSESYWLEMAKRRAEKHPKDAIEIYRRQVKPLIEATNNRAYKDAIVYMEKIHKLMQKSGGNEDFRAWLSQIKTEFKRKRNFIKDVERKSWGL